jgi:hypothetical protein
MEKILIIGLDLSLNGTGICISYLEDTVGKRMEFYKISYDKQTNKTGKPYIPDPIRNVNQIVYKMPTNLLVDDLVFDRTDTNNLEQTETTLRAMICSKKIEQVIEKATRRYQPELVIISVENYIMPSYSGSNQLKTVSALITLQGYVRKFCIQLCLTLNINIKLYTPTPSNNKLFFTINGNAEKPLMMKFFLEAYEGKKLLPEAAMDKVSALNDVVDAFSLVMNAFSKLIHNN